VLGLAENAESEGEGWNMGSGIRQELANGQHLDAELIEREDEPAPFLNVRLSGRRGDASLNLWLMNDGRVVVTPEGLGPESGETLLVRRPR
jgi:hypothetical protein